MLPMKDLVGYFSEVGCESVQTYLQSGNVVFRRREKLDRRSAAAISKRVLETKGFEPEIMFLSAAELRGAIENNPFPTDVGKALHFFFLQSLPKSSSIAPLESTKADREALLLSGQVFYLYAPEGIGRSKLAAKVERTLGVPATARNWNTVAKLSAMAGPA